MVLASLNQNLGDFLAAVVFQVYVFFSFFRADEYDLSFAEEIRRRW